MGRSFDGERRRSFRCTFGLHDWKVRGADGQSRFLACTRCNMIDDSSASIIPPTM
jgi:hypothetical protein